MPLRLVALLACLAFVWISGCNDLGQVETVLQPTGSFWYTAYNPNGTIPLAGSMHLYRQGNVLTGDRRLLNMLGVIDSGQLGGIVKSDGSIEVMFDPTRLQLYHTVIIGIPHPDAITGDVFTSGEKLITKTGTFTLSPMK